MVFSKFKERLSKSRENISHKIGAALRLHPKLDEGLWEELEEILIAADTGLEPALGIVSEVKRAALKSKADPSEIESILKNVIAGKLGKAEPKVFKNDKQIILVVGVNGTGKTTAIAKLAREAKARDKSVILAAGDTFRAAAIEQLEVWAQRIDCQIVAHQRGSDSAAVVYDSISAATARNIDFVIADTAGRLHTQTNLMEELKKIKRTAQKASGGYELVVLLVLDANTGQNALAQAKTFDEQLGVDEILLTKLDSTAKGGILISIASQTSIPVGFTGIGEGIDDLSPFDPSVFAEALIG